MNIFGLKIIFGLFLIGFILVISHILNKLEGIVNMKLLNGSEKKVAMETYIYGFIIGFFYALVMAVFTIILPIKVAFVFDLVTTLIGFIIVVYGCKLINDYYELDNK